MATTKTNAVDMNTKDQLDVWVYAPSGVRVVATINIKTDEKGKVWLITTGNVEVVNEDK